VTPAPELEGIVLRAHNGHFAVSTGEGIYRCQSRGRLRQGPRHEQAVIVPGDRVRLTALPSEREGASPGGVVEEVLPRRNRVARWASRRAGGRVEQVLMANLDQVLAVQSVTQPAPASGFVDRLLAVAGRFGVDGVLCLNKVDLDPALAADPRWEHYASAGYRVLRTSARTGEGVEALREALGGRVSLLLGSSGTGKSSLLNRLQPDLALRTGEVTLRTGLGRHTTTRTELFPLDGGGYLADSPGMRGFDPHGLEPIEVRDLFPDFTGPAQACRFRTCLHRDEPDCGVKAAVARGTIPRWRHEAYLALLVDVEARRLRPGA
jgi:ribosome biogenesis GTPase / thiamine phosphate phosphatase